MNVQPAPQGNGGHRVRARADQILVVIPTLNEAAHIEACLTSLVGDDPFMRQVRMIVADGGSRDGTTDIVDRLARRLPRLGRIHNPQRLQAAGLNLAVETEADPEHVFLIRCDAHAAYPRGYVRALADALANRPETAAIGSVMDATGSTCFQRAAAWVADTKLGSGGSAHRGGQSSGWVDHAHHAGIRLEWFRRIGGYDVDFAQNEDAEFDHRLGLAGGRVWLEAGIRLDYRMRDTPVGLWLQYWRYGRGRARNVIKHRMRPRLRQMLPVAAVLGIGASLIAGLFWLPALSVAGLYLALLCGTALVAVVALRSACGLWAGPALAAMHLAWGMGFLRQLAGSVVGR